MNNITHEQYVRDVRNRVSQVTRGMLKGEVPFLDGAIELAALRHEVATEECDADFLIFVVIASEIDGLPIGPSRQLWAKDALEKHQPEIEAATEWAKKIGTQACQSLESRFKLVEMEILRPQ